MSAIRYNFVHAKHSLVKKEQGRQHLIKAITDLDVEGAVMIIKILSYSTVMSIIGDCKALELAKFGLLFSGLSVIRGGIGRKKESL